MSGSTEKLIHADALEQLTGLSDRRHRQLAKKGYFPSPVEAMYQFAPTLRGMFKYMRDLLETDERKDKLREEHRKIKMRNDEYEGLLVRRDSVAKSIQKIFGALLPRIEQKLVTEYPSAICVDVIQGRIYGKRLFDQITEAAREFEKEWKRI